MGIDVSYIQNKDKKKPSFKRKNTAFWQKSLTLSKKLSDKKKTFIYKDLSILLKAGIDFEGALIIVKEQQKNTFIKGVVDTLLQQVVKGKAFYEAMSITKQFSSYEIFSVKIGEETRMLDVTLEELQKYFERKVKLKKQIISILAYPIFILLLTFGTLYFMLTYVVPLFESVFNQFDKELPSLTKTVIYLSDNFNIFFIFFTLILFLLFILYWYVRNKNMYKKITSRVVLKIPFFGKLVKEIYLTRFCQSMALLLVSKTSLVESLHLVKKMIGFYPIEIALDKIAYDIEKGQTLGNSLTKFHIFDSNLISMVKVAEQVNQLDEMFLRLANHFDEEVSHKTKVMGTIIEPLLILIIGGIVGVIMISMYAPMFDLSEVIGGN